VRQTKKQTIVIRDEEIENVAEFVYFGSLITSDNDSTKDIKSKIDKAKLVLTGFNTIWKSEAIRYQTKLKILKTCIFSTAVYTCDEEDMHVSTGNAYRKSRMTSRREVPLKGHPASTSRKTVFAITFDPLHGMISVWGQKLPLVKGYPPFRVLLCRPIWNGWEIFDIRNGPRKSRYGVQIFFAQSANAAE